MRNRNRPRLERFRSYIFCYEMLLYMDKASSYLRGERPLMMLIFPYYFILLPINRPIIP